MLTFINGGQSNGFAIESIKKNLNKIKDNYEGTVYFGFALSEIDNERVIIDVLIVTKEKGLLAINFSKENLKSDLEQQDRIFLLLRTLLEKNSNLRNRRDLMVKINSKVYIIGDQINDDYVSDRNFISYYNDLEDFDDKYYNALNESLDKVVFAKPRKPRKDLKRDDSYGAQIREIEKQIANMDKWQKAAAYEVPNTPQRIRGLAGSGKTVVLALKAAYLHFVDPNADIAVTFYSRTLYEQFEKMIKDFYAQYSPNDEVDFTKLHLLHAWGTSSEMGLYSEVAKHLGVTVYTYNEAVAKYGRDKAFQGVCDDLLEYMTLNKFDNLGLYDHILIDEAQDLPSSFFKICYRLFKNQNFKRLVFAYDELQNLNLTSMPTIGEMFGYDESGSPLVDIMNSEDEDVPKTDIILPLCYRNTQWALSVAHALGFGIYRSEDKPLVQFFADLEVWKKLGYEVSAGNLDYNSHVKLIRSTKSTPSYFEKYLKKDEAVVIHPAFTEKEEEYRWIAQEIKKNIEEDELDPDDILVVFLDAYNAKRNYTKFSDILYKLGISTIMPGVNIDRDTFTQNGAVTCTHIYRAKGNEKPMVYVTGAEIGNTQSELVQARNSLFTAITRSRAWVRISGVGNGMERLKDEVQRCIDNDFALEFDIPSKEEIKELNLLNKSNDQKTRKQLKQVEKITNDLMELLKNSDINNEDIPELQNLIKIIGGRN